MGAWEKYKETMKKGPSLHDLARAGELEAFNGLLTAQNINEKDAKGYSPLMLAAYNGHLELVRYLLENGADPNSVDYGESSILMGVAFKGYTEIIKLLIDYGANLEHRNSKQQTALDFAQMFGRTDAVKLIKSYQNKPEAYNFLDGLKSWSSFFQFKGER